MTDISEPPPLTRAQIASLRSRHVAFLRDYITSDQAAAAWRDNARAVYEGLLASKLGDVIDAPKLADALDAALTRDAVDRAARPIATRALPLILAEIRAERGTLGERLPGATRRKIDQLLERPNLVPDRLLRELAAQEVVEEVMRDVLFDGLKEFAQKVNPLVADWGIPALLKKLGPLGMGVGKGLDSVRAEFDKRLEPEIRRFLQGFTGKGLRRMADFTAEHGDEPKFILLRKRLAAWVLEQKIADLARSADDTTIALAQDVALDVIASELGRSALAMRRRAVLLDLLRARHDNTVAEVLAELGVDHVPAVDALAAATWPTVRAGLKTEAGERWIASLVDAFYDREALSAAP